MSKSNDKSGCDFFCFRQCGDKYDTLIKKKPHEEVEKLSLKKINSKSEQPDQFGMIKKISSQSQLEKWKISTNRSKGSKEDESPDIKELNLFKKKAKIEK